MSHSMVKSAMAEDRVEEEMVPLRTPLYALHVAHGAKIVPFAGYDMPLQYEGIVQEHIHTRTAASLFDVSHMGVLHIRGDLEAIEPLFPADLRNLPHESVRYSLLMNAKGGIEDDLLIWPITSRQSSRSAEHAFMVVINASRKEHDMAYLKAHLGDRAHITLLPMAILALQGPRAALVLKETLFQKAADSLSTQPFMKAQILPLEGDLSSSSAWVTRTGYTGEDGFEILIDETIALQVAEKLLEHPDVKLAGLGARDSLRLEAGLSLYGHELNETTSPVEAGLLFAIPKARRVSGAFLGADQIVSQIEQGVTRRRVGLMMIDKAIPREGMEILTATGDPLGIVTSGCYSPTLERSIAMGYIQSTHPLMDEEVSVLIRGQQRAACVVPLPFVPTKYYKSM